MASTLFFCEDNGAAVSLSPRGTTRTTGVSNWNWKNIDDATSTYSDYAITAGNRSFSKFNFLLFSGQNMITGVTFSHTGVANIGIGLGISGFVSGSGFYTTPATTLPTLFSVDFTPTGVSRNLLVGIGGPELSGKGLSSANSLVYSEYVGHQLATTSSAPAGDSTGTFFWSFNYTEN